MDIVLDRRFSAHRYGIGHSQLLFHAAGSGDEPHLSVLFLAVRAVLLRSSYRPLVLRRAVAADRLRILDYAEIPERHHWRYLCVTLPDPADGFVCCAVVQVLAVGGYPSVNGGWWPDDAEVRHTLRQSDEET